MGLLGDFFEKVGKTVGAIATAIVPGFDTLAKTGIMGGDLAAFASGPQTSAVQQTIVSSPAMAINTLSPPAIAIPAGMTAQEFSITPAGMMARFQGTALAAPAVAAALTPQPLSGSTINMPVEYAKALADAARSGVGAIPSGFTSSVPGAVATPISSVRAQLPTTGIPPNILAAGVFNW